MTKLEVDGVMSGGLIPAENIGSQVSAESEESKLSFVWLCIYTSILLAMATPKIEKARDRERERERERESRSNEIKLDHQLIMNKERDDNKKK